MKKLLSLVAASALLTSQANAALYDITYSFERVAYVGGTGDTMSYLRSQPYLTSPNPDPTNQYDDVLYSPVLTGADAHAIPIFGTGTLNTDTGDILLDPINIEMTIPQGSLGYNNYEFMLGGSFSGNTWTQSTSAVSYTSVDCEIPGSSPCVQSADVARFDDDLTVVFSSIGTGGTGQFLANDAVFPNPRTTINFTIGSEIAPVPVPAAAWLFGSGLLGLVGIGRKRRK